MSNRHQRRADTRAFRHQVHHGHVLTHLVDAQADLSGFPLLVQVAAAWAAAIPQRKPFCFGCRSGFANPPRSATSPVSLPSVLPTFSDEGAASENGINKVRCPLKDQPREAEAQRQIDPQKWGSGSVVTDMDEAAASATPGAYLFALPPGATDIASISVLCVECWRDLTEAEVERAAANALRQVIPGDFLDAGR
ncbi:hypothetical protein [Bradyrhizobium sp. CSS354]|uniref:hypothetical protein n=1 Tax=Bradyrhizobium sp. CSS354 TaxID=2699172 RepID=UPI0023B1FE65|nr:hypothetical protein [Bradyrhizobium sp. CSS354]MDE5465225.1 hypothetical protein [Bradyrhizobium sp. CSS354]